MSPLDVLMLASQLVSPLAMILGLWIAARWRANVIAWITEIGAHSVTSSRAGQLVVWIVLGMLFANPIVDLLGTLTTVIQLALGPAGSMGTMSTVWGHESFKVYSGITILQTIVVYVLVVWVGYRLWPEATGDEGEENTSLALEEWFVLLAIASLANRFLQSIILSIIWLPVPNSVDMGRLSSVGFFGAWLLGLALVAVILAVLLNSLRKSQLT
jgi:hypothetical protein